jgi:hypothetical protein
MRDDAAARACVRAQVQSRGGRSSVLLSIHQPNGRLLELFDHILVLGQGGSVFFGTVNEAKAYFRSRGLPVPPNQTPTDFFLQARAAVRPRPLTRSRRRPTERRRSSTPPCGRAPASASAAWTSPRSTRTRPTARPPCSCSRMRRRSATTWRRRSPPPPPGSACARVLGARNAAAGDPEVSHGAAAAREQAIHCARPAQFPHGLARRYTLLAAGAARRPPARPPQARLSAPRVPQLVFNLMYGFLCGVVFWQRPFNIDGKLNALIGGLVRRPRPRALKWCVA